MKRFIVKFAVFFLVFISACSISPRTSIWNSPQRFTKSQVFNAGLQAGMQSGMQNTASDRESGTMSFTKSIGGGQLILNSLVTEKGKVVQVRTTVNVGGAVTLSGLHESVIKKYNDQLFLNLGITDPSEKNVNVEVAK